MNISTSTSKLGNIYDRKEIEKSDKQYHQELHKMYKNIQCADCNTLRPSWVAQPPPHFQC